MAAKYHISPDTGRPNQCRAQKSCPVGGKHYDSKEEAQRSYERSMASATVAPAVSKRGPYTSPFRPNQQVEGATVWTYESIVGAAGSKTQLTRANPGITFSESPEGLLMVRGKAAVVEEYLQEPGGTKRDIGASLAALRPALPRRVKDVPPPTPPARAVRMLQKPAIEEEELTQEPAEDEDFLGDGPVSTSEWEALLSETDPVLPEPQHDLDDDWDDIKCEDCGHPISSCICDECEDCGAALGEDHQDYCVHYKYIPKAYSWE